MKNIRIIITNLLAVLSLGLFAQNGSYKLEFDSQKYKKQTLEYRGQKFNIRAFEGIVYVANPVDTVYHKMNIYIPEAYFQGNSINGYSSETAPVFFPNQIGGYMPATPASTQNTGFGNERPMNNRANRDRREGRPRSDRPRTGNRDGQFRHADNRPSMMETAQKENTVIAALSKGYVVASAGARGRTNKDGNGRFYGKAPAAIVDLKAAVRYLKYNDKAMPGDANKIISNGTSAGGAMSALLGATGNNPDYQQYLDELGAANGSDAIFATSAYCPITNLDNADMAYEWQFNGIDHYRKGGMFASEGNNTEMNLTEQQTGVSTALKNMFPDYINSLQLKNLQGDILTLDKDGNGSFKTLVKSYVIASANKALKEGTDISQYKWIVIQNNVVTDLDWDAYIRYMERQKTPPAFDALDLSSGENNLFGTDIIDNQHFTEYGQQNTTTSASRADKHIVKLMNPMYYIGTPDSETAKYWRIRHGSKDKDTGLAISAILATYLQNRGYQVDYALPWDKPHSGDYDLDELFQWIDSISR
ncbi:subtype B tannase [Dysgonomonas macrotermitis]|uniref:BD-FAE-like domain-containing protein n=1 Tax=Dysgonomonas macrotermitis TaxID=1346286 RepID=A0A1M5BRS5_9BACT|nr:subtype B tannase [Dysgonomonas macrotermitis]SHF45061.1 hypothetical protein SAMN05444362_106166 [Dysgonomonas macrotermitis]